MDSFVFFTDARMLEFWDIAKKLVASVSPIVMITVATMVVGLIINVVITMFKTAAKKKNGKEDDFEYREY